eukprot:GHVQ01029023.1.p1 GENE.GHVQ01029023.1~~GHVQ01029023.1.p1  ORF type:complete len:152 (-),score=16.02 GHVQ01029023.1:867-1322(-)
MPPTNAVPAMPATSILPPSSSHPNPDPSIPSSDPLAQIAHAHGGSADAWGGGPPGGGGPVVSGVEGGMVQAMVCLEWHPAGHIVATAGMDRLVRFWCRSPPGFSCCRIVDAHSVVNQQSTGAFPMTPGQTLAQCAEWSAVAAEQLQQDTCH